MAKTIAAVLALAAGASCGFYSGAVDSDAPKAPKHLYPQVIHTYIRACMQCTYIPYTYILTYIRTCIHTHRDTVIHPCMHICIHVCMHKCVYDCIHGRIQT